MRTIEKTVYELSELSEKAQKRAHSDWMQSLYYWDDFYIYDMKEDLTAMGLNEPEIRYSGFSCQGDGLSFLSDCVDVALWLGRELRPSEEFIVENSTCSIVERPWGNYVHEGTASFSIEWQCPNFVNDDNESKLGQIAGELERECEEKRYALCLQLYRTLWDGYDWETEYGQFEEQAVDMDWEFFEDGELV